ncbi:bifunctional nuclease family protein [Fervidibacter sacchari]|uniref:Bifunctional DNase/RNase n=1 Tax=Candidatus Fervidibacter sacchari TaxID=1448929 RepID=A0ABT2END4_9BACT|nr:bifunctional nuclease family protein [Candidatus Fervidibacter sacchari]MCS3919194.1 bifunctional DNase/RNase [Candidatus Fervidibacter sacchari]WKU17074.1 bifunctional nuclease family protein [Candidatus Fervidibacter sacchari]
MIRVQHIRVIEDHAGNPVVLLSDPETGMELPIWIGEVEAFAIQRELEGVQLPRPMTHDLLRNILVELGVELVRVEINELHDNTYYANLVLRWNGRTFFIDARPSDSIALAVRMNAPIYVAEEVAKAAGYFPQPSRKEIERFMRLIKDVELPEM